jgi:hypothetical protein
MGRLHVTHAVQRGIWVPTQHLLFEVLGRTNHLSFDTTQTAEKMTRPSILLLLRAYSFPSNDRRDTNTDTETARSSHKPTFIFSKE